MDGDYIAIQHCWVTQVAMHSQTIVEAMVASKLLRFELAMAQSFNPFQLCVCS